MPALRRSISLCLLLCVILTLSGCQPSNAGKKAETGKYRSSLTDEEKKNGRATFELMENVSVDATVTPVEKYSSGLKSYYMEEYYVEKESEDRKVFMKNPDVFGKNLEEIKKLLEQEMGIKVAETEKLEKDGDGVTMSCNYQRDTLTGEIWAEWYDEKLWSGKAGKLSGPFLGVRGNLTAGVEMPVYNIREFCKDYRDKLPSFIKDSDAMAEKIKAFLEDLTGRELSDRWDIVPVTDETMAELKEVAEKQNWEGCPESSGEYCEYFFYAAVDGLPLFDLNLTYQLMEGETADKYARLATDGSGARKLITFSECSQSAIVTGQGIVSVSVTRFRKQGDVYKDTREVVSPDEVLGKVAAFYERQLLTAPITIKDMSLVYIGYFSDGSDGEIRSTITPVWYVIAYDERSDRNMEFIYDAFTGKDIKEGGYLSWQ